jgi:hypothetical protein
VADTFADIWRGVRLRCPLAGPLLAQQWVRDTYEDVCRKHPWSWLRAEGEILTNDAKSGTVTVTRNSMTVVGVGLMFALADVDRQFRLPSAPVYTITAVDVGLNRATLDRVYGGPSATAVQGVILDAYVTMPEDFARWLVVADPTNRWQLHWWITEEELNLWDPERSITMQPWALVSRRLSRTAATNGRIQYELWPYTLLARNYPYYYIRQPAPLSDDSYFEGSLRMSGDLLLQGALVEAAEWPGTEDRKNPYFNLNLAQRKREQFERRTAELELRDEEIYLTWWETVSWINKAPLAPGDARFAQSHDFDAYNYH